MVKSFECKMIFDVNINTQWVQLTRSPVITPKEWIHNWFPIQAKIVCPNLTQMPCPLALGRTNKAEAERGPNEWKIFKAKWGPNEWRNFWDKSSDFLTQKTDNFFFFSVNQFFSIFGNFHQFYFNILVFFFNFYYKF